MSAQTLQCLFLSLWMFSINYRLPPTEEAISLPVEWSCSRGSYSFGRWRLFKELDFGFPAVSVCLSAGTMNKTLPMRIASPSRSESLLKQIICQLPVQTKMKTILVEAIFFNIIDIWAIQVLRNADGGGIKFSGGKRYDGVRFNVISVTRGGWVSNFQKKSVTQHLNGPIANAIVGSTSKQYQY